MVEHPAVASAHAGEGVQPLSRHRKVPGSTPGGGTYVTRTIESFYQFAKEYLYKLERTLKCAVGL